MATLGAHKKHKVTIVGSGNWYVEYGSWHLRIRPS